MNFVDIKPGTSAEGSEIIAFRTDPKSESYIYLMAGVHGDEVEGVYVCSKLFDWLKGHEDLDIPLVVIPILNVDGYRMGTRTNARGVDLNRNLPSGNWSKESREAKYFPGENALSELENQYLVKLFNKYKPKFIVSIHSWKPMINYNGAGCKSAAEIMHAHNGYKMVDEIEGHPTPGSLGEFGPEKYKTPVLTFECPLHSEKSLKAIWAENEKAFKGLFESDLFKNLK